MVLQTRLKGSRAQVFSLVRCCLKAGMFLSRIISCPSGGFDSSDGRMAVGFA